VDEFHRNPVGTCHTVVCLEAPKNPQFVNRIVKAGGEVLICPSRDALTARMRQADIVQIEWWHHPVMAGFLCDEELPPARWIVWSHVSGLSPPEIPPVLLGVPHRFLFTSPCSWEHPRITGLKSNFGNRVDAVFSSGGFDDLTPPPQRSYQRPLRFGFVGTMNFAKLHPRFADFIAAVRQPDFKLLMVGDLVGAEQVIADVRAAGLEHRLEFIGYRKDVETVLSGFDVLVYLLNPLHYGTTENALLEAMAMGVVPIVLNNPAERYLVEHDNTGVVVANPEAFADAVDRLSANPKILAKMSKNAMSNVREKFAIARTAGELGDHHRQILDQDKKSADFRSVFGEDPADWFLACQGNATKYFEEGGSSSALREEAPHFLFEENKGSVFHYRNVYPEDKRLEFWAGKIEQLR
jgi:glycosyltransferase involved in cell wall biosynthesis